jgi:flavin reductase (DIM6/NTAB) family NADH-FMN oxidoreductase RutF
MELDVSKVGAADRYKLLIGCVIPRPIAFVSTRSLEGRDNLAPFSFFTAVGSDPMTLLFCPANKPDGSEKDTLRNAKLREDGGTGQFVVNLAVEPYARRVAAAAESLPFGESEFELVGLTPESSQRVAPPRVAESPAAFECETMHVIRTNPGAAGGGNVVIGRVVHAFVRDGAIDDQFRVNPDALAAIARMGGFEYARTRERFAMRPGRATLDSDPPFPGV